MRYRPGDKLRGETKAHCGKVTVLRATKQRYFLRFDGGQHNGKREVYLSRTIVESHYGRR